MKKKPDDSNDKSELAKKIQEKLADVSGKHEHIKALNRRTRKKGTK